LFSIPAYLDDQSSMLKPLVIVVALGVASAAYAGPSVTVTPDAPFDEHALGEALALRIADDVVVHVSRDADGRLVVDVSGKRQIVDPQSLDPQSAARVVAMVVIALVEEPAPIVATAPPGLTVAPVTAPIIIPYGTPPQSERRTSIRIVPSIMRDDSGYVTTFFSVAVARQISAHARLVATGGIGLVEGNSDSRTVVPLRLGLEGIAGALGLELGVFSTRGWSTCGSDHASGLYGALRVKVPLTDRLRGLIEGGGEFSLATSRIPVSCEEVMLVGWKEYAGWAGAGVEWSF
jgi:hypothetical protein